MSAPGDKKKQRKSKARPAAPLAGEEGAGSAPKTAAPAPIGSAREEAPPPIEGPLRAMVIMAHPDDAEFVCGGTVAKWCAEGWEVRYVVVTGGDKGTHDPAMHPEKLAAIREEEQRAACRVLGVRECILLGYPDGFTVDEHELRGQIVRLLRIHRPEVVVTWDAYRKGFNHRDHRNIGTVTADAIYPIVRDRLFYPADEDDGLESHQVNEVLLAGTDDADYVVDITDHWETKVSAILCHASQVGGRTREDFVKMRKEQVERDGEKPIEERFRRWSIRRPPRAEEKKEDEAAAEAVAEAAPDAAPAAAAGGALTPRPSLPTRRERGSKVRAASHGDG
ncbi:MAG: PIG-L deacetylase family protein [Tepidiformaceae bacterium]